MNDLSPVKSVWVIEFYFILNLFGELITFFQVVQAVSNQLVSISLMGFVGMLLFKRVRTLAEVLMAAIFV